MFPKTITIKDSKAIEQARKPYSEISGKPVYGAAPHHVISVGAGGPDHRFNLIQTTDVEHIDIHKGLISRDFLFALIAVRENVTVEYLKAEINRMRGR